MRTTVNLDDEIVAAVEQLQRTQGLGTSEAINLLARRGLARTPVSSGVSTRFVQRTAPLGLRLDVSNVADVLELLDTNTESC